ncbi:MAG: MmpS family protein [Nocardiaceae bacterium]|nr:MmpS family protein [Nocardiaceae bacterium]
MLYQSQPRAARRTTLRAAIVAVPLAIAAAATFSPLASADEMDDQHSVTYQITGAPGTAYSIVADGMNSIYPEGDQYPSLPFSATVTISSGTYVVLSFTDRDGGPHECNILVDGVPVPVERPSTGVCAYQLP